MYSKLQKFTSFFLIFFLLASFSFRLPFIWLLSYTFAVQTPFHNIVSIIVDEEIYSSVKNELERYSMDIQWVLENTKVIILPTPKKTSAFNIASLNESLYYDWLKGIKPDTTFESKLIWTVLVWDLNIPTVFNRDDSSKTIVPYIDFIDKSYVWDNENEYYKISEDNLNGLKAEIWHWVISPNLWNKWSDILAIKDYFSKNHDFYQWTWNFKTASWILNWNNLEWIPANYDPFVFYFDQIRESKSLIYSNYLWYNQTLDNREDLVYNRFSNELATRLQNWVLKDDKEEVADMIAGIDPTFDKSLMWDWPNLDITPEIQSRHVIQKSTKKLVEIFNPTTLWEFKKDIHNAWRYNWLNKKVNMDSPSFIISSLDTINTEIIKSITNELEDKIDILVATGWLSRKIAIPTKIEYKSWCDEYYTNFLYWFQASKINKAEDCSIYRWNVTNSGTLVEANRWINLDLAKADWNLCWAEIKVNSWTISEWIWWYWGWNTPLNLMWNTVWWVLKIWAHDLKWWIVKVLDITWSKEIKDATKVHTPLNCFDNNYLLTYEEGFIPPANPFSAPQACGIKYQVPIDWKSAVKWNCNTTNIKYSYPKSFNENYKNPDWKIILDWVTVAWWWSSEFYYKKITSHIFHKSPTADELWKEVNAMVTPSLPIDKDRYIDFIGAAWNYATIWYPYIFRIEDTWEQLDLDAIKLKLKKYLDRKSLEVNNVLNASDPSSLEDKDLEIYELLKIAGYPRITVDFYNDLVNKPDKQYIVNWDSKNANYLDTIAFAIYWNNLKSISSKYKFIFEYYLSDEMWWNDFNFHLPKNKKLYEIAYIWAPWDATNMYVKLDPEAKNDTPYPDVIQDNALINNQLLAANIANRDTAESNKWQGWGEEIQFKCAPPEWVPIFEWFPAITCWLWDLLPPKISISGWVCWSTVLWEDLLNPLDFFTEEEKKEILSCEWDINKNWVNDCIEYKLNDWSLKLTTDSQKYYYNRSWDLKAEILDKDWKLVRLDNDTYIKFIIDKIEVPLDSKIEFNELNKKVVYDSLSPSEWSQREINKYITFSEREIRASSWVSKYSFSTKRKDANIIFKTIIDIKDNNDDTLIPLESDPVIIKIRSDQLFLNSSKITNTTEWAQLIEELWYSSVVSSDINLFLTNIPKDELDNLYNNINSSSTATEKVVLNIENISKSGNNLEINYPIQVQIEKDSKQILEEFIINKTDLESFHKLLSISESWSYNIVIKDNFWLEVNKQIDFVAWPPTELNVQLWSTVIENESNITTNLVSVYDSLWNIVSWEYLSLDININWDWLNFEQNWDKDISFKMFEWYKAFRLKSTDVEWDRINKVSFSLKDSSWITILAKTVDIRTLKDVNIVVTAPPWQWEIKVWRNKLDFDIELRDSKNKLITDLNSRAYVVVSSMYWETITPYVLIEWWKGRWTFMTSIVSWKQIPIEIQVEWVNTIYKVKLDIFPEEPVKVDIILNKSKMEASPSEYSYLSIHLKDRYWNIVFDDDTTVIDFELLPEYKWILTTPIKSKIVSGWKTNFKIYWTSLPWQWFFKVKTTPDISKNSFDIKGQAPFRISELSAIPWILTSTWLTLIWSDLFKRSISWQYISKFWTKETLIYNDSFEQLPKSIRDKIEKLWDDSNTLTIYWVWENVWKIETFYYWDEEKFKWTKYNALYSTFLWAQYWDITKKWYIDESWKLRSWYLAWWLIFDKGNRSLAVTSLLNNTYKYDDVITILPEWWVRSIYATSILTQDVKYSTFFEDNKLNIWIYNESLNTFIWRLLYNFDSNVSLKSCTWKSLDFNDCSIDLEKTLILLKNLSDKYITYIEKWQLILKTSYWKKLLVISSDWTIDRRWNLDIELKEDNTNNYAIFNLKVWNETIWLLWIRFSNWKVVFSRDQGSFEAKKNTIKNSILWIIKTNTYWTRDIIWTKETIASIYYNDPFWNKKKLNNFSDDSEYSYENFNKEKWLWWNKWNKSLLEFSAWTSVWDSTKNNTSFSLINIWDPVISLKKIQKNLPWTPPLTFIPRNFDATIWKVLSKSNDNLWYKVFDYNNDSRDDILLIKRDGSISLLENKDKNGEFLDKWDLAHLPDLWNKELVLVWNFSWDWYDDMFFINKVWKPFLLQNLEKNFVRFPLTETFNLSWEIIRAESFDMDNDWIDDIITLDNAWEINIFYWSVGYKFTKKTIWNWYWIILDKEARNDNAFIYFDWIQQVDENWVPSTEIDINEALVDNLLFVNIPYTTDSYYLETKDWRKDSLLNSIPDLTSAEVSWWIAETNRKLLEFTDRNQDYLNYVWDWNSTKQTSFMKSEYSEIEWIKIEKIFNDENWWYVKSHDRIKVNVKVKNTGSTTFKNMAYIDSIPSIFILEKDSIEINSTSALERKAPSWYDILVNNFSLAPGQEMRMTYYLNTLPIKHSFIQVWLFEPGEIWDDQYWDILLKRDEQNCWENSRIYQSQGARSYLEKIKIPNCDAGKIQLPDELVQNQIDTNKNWIPDYIDELQTNDAALAAYSKTELDNLNFDTDWDWIPDREDEAPNYNNDDGGLLDSLDNINSITKDISEQLDTFVDWLWCWFWGWACFSLPMNWAPLAPWGDPVVFGKLVWDWLNVEEWIPIFSALTWMYYWPVCAPIVWPVSVLGQWCSWLGAWWILWTDNITNFFRLFVTPTLTWAVWIAMCFWPAEIVWCLPPPWTWIDSDCTWWAIWWPLIPYWNCIVMAKPLDMCSSDGSDWDPWSVWEAQSASEWYNSWEAWSFWVINWNCSYENKDDKKDKVLDTSFVKDYLSYKKTWVKTPNLETKYDSAMDDLMSNSSPMWNALISLDGWISWEDMEVSADVNTDALLNWDFSDVLEIKMERTWWFPDFLMSWVTRQIEEIKTKLTDWPTIYIVLPDFTWLFDWWDNFLWWLWNAFDTWAEERKIEEAIIQTKIDTLKNTKDSLDCSWDDFWQCLSLSSDIAKNELLQDGWISFAWIDNWVSSMRRWASWIESVYKFLSNTPLVDIQQEIVYINIPWIDGVDIEKALVDWKLKYRQWKEEIETATWEWSLWNICTQSDPAKKAQCEEQNTLNEKVSLNANDLLYSLERNIEILEWYKDFPRNFYKLIKVKEFYLEQILCNLDTIALLIWWRIWDNWKRFKAWVELYITIKAILKSWQLLIDIFADYDAECHQCKNERDDSLYSQFKVLSLILPEIPVIQFPKWPDIIIDLHNVRVNLKIYLPDFKFNLRPIVLPQLPNLYLPSVPNVNINLPELPLLPELTLPTLPDLPTLPRIELPNLPPPPTLPELFSALEAILEIVKLLVKILCILKTSPLVPEWRAWDQIAYITERQWYLWLDFLNMSLPQFSFPFIDAVKVSSYVNLEFETAFIVELAKQAVSPINSMTNNISNMFDIHFDDLDFSWYTPSDINIWLNEEKNLENAVNKNFFAIYLSKRIMTLYSYIDENKNAQVDSKSFISLVNKSLASTSVVSNPRYNELRNLWSTVAQMTYSKEDKLIKELKETNTEKFEAIKNIIRKEIKLNKDLWKEITQIEKGILNKVGFKDNNNIEQYNKSLDKYNAKFIKSAVNLVYWKDEKEIELKKEWEKLASEMQEWVSNFSKQYLDKSDNDEMLTYNKIRKSNNWLLALSWPKWVKPAQTSCQAQAETNYSYKYEGIYVLEWDQSYNLFDYTSVLSWKEKTTVIDFDEDWDEDLLYMVSWELYLKENLNKKKAKIYISDAPIVISPELNKFYNNDTFYESVNYFNQLSSTNGFIDASFNSSTNLNINNYRLEFYTIIDKWLNIDNSLYSPKKTKKSIVDSFADINKTTLILEDTSIYYLRENLAHINYVWTVPWVELRTKSLINIKEEIDNWSSVHITSWTKIYSSNEEAFNIEYYLWESEVAESKYVWKNENITFKKNIKIIWLSWKAYIEWVDEISLQWSNIKNYIWLPLIPWAKIEIIDNELSKNEASHIDIKYFDNTELNIDLREVYLYNLYDLWLRNEDYTIRIKVPNDFYYWKIRSFSKNIFSTTSRSILSAPQVESDLIPPENNIREIRVPIFQEYEIDLGPYIFEEWWITNIKDVFIDLDLEVDASNDWKPKNDRDSDDTSHKITIDRSEKHIILSFWPYDQLEKKKIWITLIDKNDNVWFKVVNYEVYAPSLSIDKYDDNLIEWIVDNKDNSIPISFFRFRGWILLPLENRYWDSNTYSFDDWNFIFKLKDTLTWIKLEQSWTEVASINEYTWQIIKKDWTLDINVYASNSTENNLNFPKIEINKWWKVLFTEFIQLLNSPIINIIDDFDYLNEFDSRWFYLKFIDKISYNYYKIPEWVLYNPWTLVIYKNSDTTKKALFTIFKDWRINTLNDNYQLIYDTQWNYIKLLLKHKITRKTIAELLIFIDWWYVIN